MDTTLSPLPSKAFGPAQARHLLLRSGLGGSPAEAKRLATLGLDAAVEQVVRGLHQPEASDGAPEVDPDILRPPTPEERQRFQEARRSGDQAAINQIQQARLRAQADDRRMMRDLRNWWLERLAAPNAPAHEKLVLLWHGHFASSHRQVRDAFLMYQQQAMFRLHATDFAALAHGIVRDPAMIKYLNNDRNVQRKPNENLARELMELFTLGEGNYTEDDIKQGARALTGYTVDDNSFTFNPRTHDPGDKEILGQRGNYDGDEFVDLLLQRPQCPAYVALKLYRHYVADVSEYLDQTPSDHRAAILALAKRVATNRYDLRPALTALFKSKLFYDDVIVGTKIKSPVELTFGTAHQLQTPQRNSRVIEQAMVMMGQKLFEPPSVAGWPVGREWINTSTLFVRQNTCAYLIAGKAPNQPWSAGQVRYEPMKLLADQSDRSPEAVTNYFVDALLGPHVPAARREPFITFMKQRDKGVTNDSLVALLLLITASPEYQLC